MEVLAGMAAATLIGQQRAWLEGIVLTLRTVQHEVNNKLCLTSGYAEILALDASVPANVRQAASKAQQGAKSAAGVLNELEPLSRLDEDIWSRPTPTAARVKPWAPGQRGPAHG